MPPDKLRRSYNRVDATALVSGAANMNWQSQSTDLNQTWGQIRGNLLTLTEEFVTLRRLLRRGRGSLPFPTASGLEECAQSTASAEAPPTKIVDDKKRLERRRANNNVRPTSSESHAATEIEAGSPVPIQTLPEPPVSLSNGNTRSYARVAAATHAPNSAVTSVIERRLTQRASRWPPQPQVRLNYTTGHRRNDEGPEPTLVGGMTMVTDNRKDRPDDVVPTQLETGKEMWATVARRASVDVIPSTVFQRLRTKSMPATKNEEGTRLQ
ncbi:unnamed protein product [Echinostoma caproni]|uniref:Uncharacterized protein n=1 Tax=Echinostoma caproni TaxID=27848 RepID=A0A183B143_9TREM|nr:unnamed protein product [Echinostoma caproni]